jgi:hypothetical protein
METTIAFTACPVCNTPRPRNRRGPDIWCCTITCYRTWHHPDEEAPNNNQTREDFHGHQRGPPMATREDIKMAVDRCRRESSLW